MRFWPLPWTSAPIVIVGQDEDHGLHVTEKGHDRCPFGPALLRSRAVSAGSTDGREERRGAPVLQETTAPFGSLLTTERTKLLALVVMFGVVCQIPCRSFFLHVSPGIAYALTGEWGR